MGEPVGINNGGGGGRGEPAGPLREGRRSRDSLFSQKEETSSSWASSGVTLSANHLSYYVEVKKKRKALLRDISIVIKPGEMAYMMGPSGAGKSTLLDALAGRMKLGIMSGEILFNGCPRDRRFWRESAYVRQDDVHIPILTVRETLRFAAKLRMGSVFTDAEREERVRAVAELLGLNVCLDSICGDATLRGISGGQMKRLSIGVEMVHLPSLLFLDEPTSGLDSVISLEVMTFVYKLACQQRTVISTIHQPSPDTFALASKVVLLAAGHLCYCGPAKEVADYLQAPPLGFVGDGFSNPADFIISAIGGAQVPLNGSRPLTPAEFSEAFRQSAFCCAAPLARVTRFHLPEDSQPPGFPTSLWRQFQILLHRSWMTQVRQVEFIRAQVVKNVVVALVCGAIFYAQGSHPVPSAAFNQTSFNVSSILYFAMMYTILGNLQAIPQLFAMRVLYVRERSASVYSTLAYWAANAVVNLPLVVACHVIFLNIAYWMVQLSSDPRVYWYMLVNTLLNNLVAFYFAQFLAAAAPSAQVALAIFPVTFLFLTSFAGFTVPLQDLPPGWRWAAFLSYPRWCYEGILASQFSVRIDGKATLTYYGFHGNKGTYVPSWESRYWDTAPILLGFIVVMNCLVYRGLLPARSRLKHEPAAATGEGQAGMVEEEGDVALQVAIRDEAEGEEDELETPLLDGGKAGGGGLEVRTLMGRKRAASAKGARAEEQGSSSTSAEEEEDVRRLSSLIMGTLASAALINEPSASTYQAPGQGRDRDSLLRPSMDVKDFERRTHLQQKSSGIRLLFRNLEYAIPVRARGGAVQRKRILQGVSGRINPGEMCALMGGSGAGKSTLLDVLAGRKTSGYIKGEVYFNGRRGSPSSKRCSYVTQDNVHIGSFTVRETLHYASLLRIREGASAEERRQRVEQVMGMLGLEEVADVIVGDSLRKGISGGQARRLSIGVEIIHLPDLIFLDEPTTGLDSNISYEVMAAVRNLANQNRSIVCTIHQPSIEVFALFDKLILMAMGQQVYYGSTHEAVRYFSSATLDFDFSKGTNPAEFVMAAVGGTTRTRGGLLRGADELARLYRESDLFWQFNDGIAAMVASDASADKEGEPDNRIYPRDMLEITRILNQRQFMKLRKYRRPAVVGIIRHVLVALFYGSLYWQVEATAIQSRLSLLFFAIMFVMLGNQQTIPAVYEDRLLYYREKGANVYGAYSYWMTCATSYVPQNVLNTLIYCSIVYFMAGLNAQHPGCFGYFWLVVMLCSLCALFFCQLLAISLPSPQTAVAVFPATLFLFIAFAGFIVRLPSLPSWLGTWAPLVSFARWAFQGLVLNEFQDNPRVSFSQLPTIYYTPEPCQAFMASLGFDGVSKWFSIPILLINMVIFRVLAYYALVYINYEKR